MIGMVKPSVMVIDYGIVWHMVWSCQGHVMVWSGEQLWDNTTSRSDWSWCEKWYGVIVLAVLTMAKNGLVWYVNRPLLRCVLCTVVMFWCLIQSQLYDSEDGASNAGELTNGNKWQMTRWQWWIRQQARNSWPTILYKLSVSWVFQMIGYDHVYSLTRSPLQELKTIRPWSTPC